ncbi:MAG: hypothetical protein JRI23_33370 [Deltaproteobacteria bacterium]|nr:hypothetical protein [Deltaproteobacteria bacterium]MBW2537169.1 hypothetical protein [Deltaproteobacteria bacterium]
MVLGLRRIDQRGVRAETVQLLRHGEGGFRLWRGDEPPAPGATPSWTANRMKDRPLIYFP